jgi:hypothetical protein
MATVQFPPGPGIVPLGFVNLRLCYSYHSRLEIYEEEAHATAYKK